MKKAQKSLLKEIYNYKAHQMVNKLVAHFMQSHDVNSLPVTYDFPDDPIILHSNCQFQRETVGYSFKEMDDLYGSLGNFGIYAAIMKITISPSRKGYRILLNDVGLYMRDTYDFLGDQYLGHWCDEGLKLELLGGARNIIETIDERSKSQLINEYNNADPVDSNGNPIEAFGNSDYNKFRKENLTGGDLLLFSDVKKVTVNIEIKARPKWYRTRNSVVL